MFGSTFEDDIPVPSEIHEIRVKGATGSVEVRPGTAPQVTIHRKVRYFRPFQSRPGPTHHVDGDTLYLDTNKGTVFPNFVAVNYVVDVPPQVRVNGHLSSGSLRLTGVSAVDVRTSSGSIALARVTGDITAKSSSGSIKGQELRSSRVEVKSSSGRLSLDLAQPADVTAKASSGSIDVAVPDSHYRVDTKVSSGRTRIEVPNDPAGAHHLDLRTSSGAITVARR